MCQENGKRRTWTEKRGCVYDGVCVYRQTSVIDGRVFTGVYAFNTCARGGVEISAPYTHTYIHT